jgi:quinoprotein glucose dehydrogenase
MRCHRIEARGGQVGPELSSIGKEKDRKYLLQAIVDPNGAIAKNFETVLVATDDGLTYSGILQTETDDQLVLMTPESKTVTIEKKTIEQRGRGISSMPADLIKNLSASEIRDLVEFLSSLN